MKLDPKKVAFGRHESFQLRFSWLTKGFQELQKEKSLFESEDVTVRLGVGRNMVNAIRYWLQATQIVFRPSSSSRHLEPTVLGEKIFSQDGWDPYLEDEGTIWLLHWLIVSNPENATAWYWFFNRFHKPEFTAKEVAKALQDFVTENIQANYSAGTIKRDTSVLLRMYIQSKGQSRIPLEEALDSPLSLLKLITYTSASKTYISRLDQRNNLPIEILGFALTQIFDQLSVHQMPIEDLMYSDNGMLALGSAFRLSETALLTKLEQLIRLKPDVYQISESEGIQLIHRHAEVTPYEYLKSYYMPLNKEEAA